MARTPVSREPVDYADTQGLVRFGFKRMTVARYELLRVKDARAARDWLRTAPVTCAVATTPPPTSALQIAFTATGLAALGVHPAVVAGFSHEFRGGMAQESRARQLGDVGENAPSQWDWGVAAREPHLVAMFFAEPGQFDGLVERCTGGAWRDAFERVRSLETSDQDGVEPFGFADGASQPQIDWEQQRITPVEQMSYTNVVALGEFLLGYPNEYGKLTDRPLLAADAASAGLLPAAGSPQQRDLGKNGTYLVIRQLEQDVRAFWQCVVARTGGDFAAADRLAAAMVGRTRAGEPLVPVQTQAIPGIEQDPEHIRQNQFTYEPDPAGTRCPFGAHVRRANPRTTDFPGHPAGLAKLATMLGFGTPGFHDDLMSSVRFHRILRRGREYGPSLAPEAARSPAPADEPRRGLQFVCLNANITRQFEFVQNAWLANAKFSGLSGESDPLVGNRVAAADGVRTDAFTRPHADGLGERVEGLPRFVRVRGGAYFFLPSLRALRYFTGAS